MADGDLLLDLDYALSKIGVAHRNMELADAYYMIQRHNEQVREGNASQGGNNDA